jgi:hypothetical protein
MHVLKLGCSLLAAPWVVNRESGIRMTTHRRLREGQLESGVTHPAFLAAYGLRRMG